MDCGAVVIKGPKAKEIYDYMMNPPEEVKQKWKENREKREQRLKEFEEKLGNRKGCRTLS